MNLNFKKAKWIWKNDVQMDEYLEFKSSFLANKDLIQILKISADSDYNVYVNDELIAFGQYPDYPFYKVGDQIDISNFTKEGNNDLRIVVWYYGKTNMSYSVGRAKLIYEISENDDVIAYSNRETLVRYEGHYANNKCKDITTQLGLTYEYSITQIQHPYENSLELDEIIVVHMRPIKRLELKDRTYFKKVFGGTYQFPNGEYDLPTKMQKSYLSFIRSEKVDRPNTPFEISSDDGNNVYFIVDLNSEECGYLCFDITLKEDCDVFISFGEHLSDGRVRTHKRNFTITYHGKKGRNEFLNTFRRLGCRYLQFFVQSDCVKVDYAGIRPVEYPLTFKKPNTNNLLRDTIYEISEKTLSLCMHTHYEDCPWREQALYTMDSRNQMLFGYYAFSEFEFPRASLYLISKGLRKKDGLLDICFPTDNFLTIPSFSLIYFIEMYEYYKYSNDLSLLKECYPVLQKLMNTFLSRIDDTGLCPNFYDNNGTYWGFFEWSETLTGIFGETEKRYECPLNALLSIALQNLSKIAFALSNDEDSNYYIQKSNMINENIKKAFWSEKDKLFASFSNGEKEKYSTLVNALCVLSHASDKLDLSNIEKILKYNESFDDKYVIPITLSMHVFRYDALLQIDKDNKEFVLNDIDETYLYMLRKGATTFWETIKGEDDFTWVGSLCHGWSALPIYYYETLL